ncbi:MAG: MATE family efflux transporter [Lachnospiraceae bacterium]|jgi:putative MATE family efflux protein|nr:MATE family efflux transporter [Lachnospiraceae bacterium]
MHLMVQAVGAPAWCMFEERWEIKSKTIINDLTTGNITVKLLAFAWPFMLANMLQVAYNLVDMVIIGQFVGKTGLTAVSNGGEITALMTFVGMGFSQAAQVIVSQLVGQKDYPAVNKAVGNFWTFLALMSVVMTTIGLLIARTVIGIMNVPAEAYDEAVAYCTVCICGIFFIFGYNAVAAVLRGMGDSVRPLVFIAMSAAVNLVLDLLFVGGFGMGAFGAALATIIGQAVSFVTSMAYLYVKREEFCFDFKPGSFALDQRSMGVLLRLGVPMSLQSCSVLLSKMFVKSYINSYGLVISAIDSVGARIGQTAMIVTGAISAAATSMIGQNIGAKDFRRVHQTIWLCLAFGVPFVMILAGIVAVTPEGVFGLFTSDGEVLGLCHIYVPVVALNFLGFAIRGPMMALVNGVGHSKLSMTIGVLDGIVCRVLFALFLGKYMGLGYLGFWFGDVCASQLPFFIGGAYYLSGRWKRFRLFGAA